MHFKKSNDNQSTILHEGSVPYLTFKKLDQAGVRHGFSTRMGGVSEGMFSTLNLSYNRGDKKEAVDENFRRISEAIGFDHTKLVFSNQIHETRIHKVTKEDCGKVMMVLLQMSRGFRFIQDMQIVCLCFFMIR